MSAEQERAAVVAWLREREAELQILFDDADVKSASIIATLAGGKNAFLVAADAIERGEHTPQADDAQTVEGGSHDNT